MSSDKRFAQLFAVLTLLAAAPTWASWGLHAEGGAALHLSAPQRDYFGLGFGGALGGSLALGAVLDATVDVGYVFLPRAATSPLPGNGTSLATGVGLRVHRPLEQSSVVPALEAQLQYVRTGSLDRLGFTAAAQVLIRLGDESPFWLGPFARIQYVLHMSNTDTFPTADAALLSFGVAMEFSSEPAPSDRDGDGVPDQRDECPDEGTMPVDERGCPIRQAAVSPPPAPKPAPPAPAVDTDGDGLIDADDACPTEKGPLATKGCPDADGDLVIDRVDACPNAPGKPEDGGCPRYSQIVVTSSKIELKQKIFFAFGLSTILPKSFPLLDEVTQALKDRSRLCVRIEGHTDAVGSAERNLKLSDERASSVRSYLVSKGIAPTSLVAKGYGQTLPLESNATPAGREVNRRVEFVILPCPETRP